MTRTWINAVFDRTYVDIQDVIYNPNQENPKGCWNATDLNRIEKNTAYCAEWMLEKKIVRVAPEITILENDYWTNDMIPTKSEIDRIINNIRVLIQLSSTNPAISQQLPTIYPATQINYILANQIEYALDLMHNQPKLPSEYWSLKLTNGIVTQIVRDTGEIETPLSDEVLVAEDERVTIKGTPYGPDAQFQEFTNWSGSAQDINLLNDWRAPETTFVMPYRNVYFTGNFITRIPRTLTINSGYISINKDPSAESGPSTGTYYAGDEIMIIANVAPTEKKFYEWTGTQAGLNNITEGVNSSTCTLVMPDCDVTLSAFYINAGKHLVTVNGGMGGGYYDYKERVTIIATIPNKYAFSYWSGNTNYLSSIYKTPQTFIMGDTDLTFTANFSYSYSYNTVQVINGLIRVNGNDVDSASRLREYTEYDLIPTPPDSTQGLEYWEVNGAGTSLTDFLGNPINKFGVGDGNAIITGHYSTLYTLTIENVNNANSSTSQQLVKNRRLVIDTNEVVGDYIFHTWLMNGSPIASYAGTTLNFYMPEYNTTLHAQYRLRNTVNVIIDYGDRTESVNMLERETRVITANSSLDGVQFLRWDYSNIYNIANRTANSTTFTAGSSNGTITAVYANSHTLTVNNGSGSSMIIEGQTRGIDANQAPSGYEFDYWEINSGDGTISNIYAKATSFRMGTTNAEITAHYKLIPSFTVTMENGYVWDRYGLGGKRNIT